MRAEQIKAINESPYMAYVTATGGGSTWVGEFLNHGGGSKTLVGFHVPYHQKEFDKFIGASPREKYVSCSSARQLAMSSFLKCAEVHDRDKSIGIGVTCSLRKPEGEREGRKNVFYIALQSINRTYSLEVVFEGDTLDKLDQLARQYQESIVCNFINNFLFWYIVDKDSFVSTIRNVFAYDDKVFDLKHRLNVGEGDDLEPLLFGDKKVCICERSPYPFHGSTFPLIFPGSFGPVHDGHIAMARKAEEIFEDEAVFEISITNFEKPPIDFYEMSSRASQIYERGHSLVISNTPRFAQKAELFPNAIFIVGIDTYDRITDEDFKVVMKSNCKFLVFPRGDKDYFINRMKTDTCFCHYHSFSLKDFHYPVSSTQIRQNAV